MLKPALTALPLIAAALPAMAQDAPYDRHFLTVSDAERAYTAENVETLGKIFDEAIMPRDWDRLRALYSDNYVQHNPDMPDGKEGVIALFDQIDYAQFLYERVMTIAEGPYVIAVSKLRFNAQAPLMFVVDINFITEGKSREHWDILMPVEDAEKAFAMVHPAREEPQEVTEANKARVAEFMNVVFNKGQADRVPEYVAEDYVQHGVGKDGPAALMADVKTRFAGIEVDIKRIVAQNDLVLAHSRVFVAGQQIARTDIWRLRDGMLIEHWAAQQPVPAEMAHRNGMF